MAGLLTLLLRCSSRAGTKSAMILKETQLNYVFLEPTCNHMYIFDRRLKLWHPTDLLSTTPNHDRPPSLNPRSSR